MTYEWKDEDSEVCAAVSRIVLEAVGDDIGRAGVIHGALASSLIAMALSMGRPDAAELFQAGFRAGGHIGRRLIAEGPGFDAPGGPEEPS